MPHSQTILRASSVTRSMSLPAPVVMRSKVSSSLTRPPIRTAIIDFEVLARVGVLVVDRELHGHAQRAAARDDRHLVERVGVGDLERDQRVSGLVVGGDLLLFVRDDQRLALDAHQDLVFGDLEVVLHHRLAVLARREQRRFVDEVREIGSREPRCGAGQDREVDVRGQRNLPRVDLQDLLAAAHVGASDDHLPVESAGAQEGGVEHVGAVGRGDQDHAVVGLEAVHLDEELIERLLALVVAAAQARRRGDGRRRRSRR